MTRISILIAATLAAVALPVGVAHADDPPVVIPPVDVVTAPTDYCNVVIIVDPPVGPGAPAGPGTTIFAPCGADVVIPPLVLDQPATLGTVAAAPVVAARLGYVPAWVLATFGSVAA